MPTTPSPLPQAAVNDPLVRDAIAYAQKHLSPITRSSGEDYATHGMEVAETLGEVMPEADLLAVAILHDLPVHPDGKHLLEQSPLSADQQQAVLGMHGLRQLHIDNNTEELDKVISAFAEDSRLLLLRMAHRLNDVRHLPRFDAKRKKEIAHETLHMYTAISGRLGFHRWRWQMEDICFMELQPTIAQRMRKRFDESRAVDRACLHHAKTFIEKILRENGIHADIEERIKGLYSTYRKMVLKNKIYEELMDRLALRILVPETEDCYRALGIIHSSMRPVHGKLKDYIGMPKENGYKSIHTVVYPLAGISELPIEIQIRTHAMHRECEYGIASHGEYKNWRYTLASAESRANLFRNLESLHAIVRSQRTFTQALKHSFNDKRMLVFDPQNNVYHLPRPSTAKDFIEQIAKQQQVTGVRINGRDRGTDTPLNDGDTVEVVIAAMEMAGKKG